MPRTESRFHPFTELHWVTTTLEGLAAHSLGPRLLIGAVTVASAGS